MCPRLMVGVYEIKIILITIHHCLLFLEQLVPSRFHAGEGNGIPLQYSCLENPMDGGAWKAAVHGVAEGQTRLSDFTFTFHFSLSCIGEGNGNPLQCSCLENPRDGGAWWAAVYGVTQSRTRLKWPSSSSRFHARCCLLLLQQNSAQDILLFTMPCQPQPSCFRPHAVYFHYSFPWPRTDVIIKIPQRQIRRITLYTVVHSGTFRILELAMGSSVWGESNLSGALVSWPYFFFCHFSVYVVQAIYIKCHSFLMWHLFQRPFLTVA